MDTLMDVAKRTQGPVIGYVKKAGLQYKSFWITNIIAVYGAPLSFIEKLTDLEQVKGIESNKNVAPSVEEPQLETLTKKHSFQPEWNLEWINAPKVWAKGFKGKGMTVGVSDTGIIHTHEALVDSYRGNKNGSFEHNHNWFDATKNLVAAPEDDNGHGTHCTGTAAGGLKGRQIGVAPEAKWIHCRSMKIGTREWSPATFIGCLQFFLAPTDVKGQNPNPVLRPHSTSHSYGCGSNLGCPDPLSMKPASEALKAAGVFMHVSAGNSGPRCSSVNTQPGFYEAVYTVGALNLRSDTIASFSSRGPVNIDNSNRMKPDISAPGVNVVSAASRGGYVAMSGTSMASPAVNGAVALIWEAVPSLNRNIEKTIEIINKSAKKVSSTDCNSPGGVPNNVYGHGNINVDAAITLAKKLYRK